MDKDLGPFIAVTAILDQAARPAQLTVSHGDAIERAFKATSGETIAGLDIIELPIASKAFASLRESLSEPESMVAAYDVFPLAAKLDAPTRKAAAQFLAAEALWALEESGGLGSVPLSLRIEVPDNWGKLPKQIHEKLVAAGALDLSPAAIDAFRRIKASWDASAKKPS